MQHQDIKAKRNNLPTPPLRILFLWICPWKWQVEFYVWYILTLCLESNYVVNKKNYVFWKIRKMVNSCFTGGPLILRIQSVQPSLLRGLLLFSKSATLWESYSNCNYSNLQIVILKFVWYHFPYYERTPCISLLHTFMFLHKGYSYLGQLSTPIKLLTMVQYIVITYPLYYIK